MRLTDKHGLYKFGWDCGRNGSVSSLFFAHEDEVNKNIGSYIYFGEILGKHSEVRGTLEEKDITRLDIDGGALQQLYDALASSSRNNTVNGHNPLAYIHCGECKSHEDDCWCNHCTECTELKTECGCK